MKFIAVGAAAPASFIFLKNGVPTTPASPPTITAAYYPSGALLSPLPAIGAPTSPGEYTPDVFSAAQTLAAGAGYYVATAYTSDTTMDYQTSLEEWTAGAVEAGLTAQGYTAVRAGYLDNLVTLVNRLGAITGSGANTLKGYIQALASKVATLPSDIGGTFDPAADSTEAISDAIAAQTDPLAVPVPGAYAAGTAGYDISLLPSIQASTAQIGNGTLFSPVPVGDGGVTTIVLGSSYLLADGLQLDYTLSGYPALDIGAVATWYSYTALGPYSLPGIVTAINGVRFELTAAQSARLRGQVYSIAAPLVGGDVIKTPDTPLVLLNSIPNKA